MPALNFKAQFAEAVSSGEKRQTVRAPRKDGRNPKAGDTLHLYTGMRTKACRKLREARCTEVAPVVIDRLGRPFVRYADMWLSTEAIERFAKADGFKDGGELANWFEQVHGLPFKGFVIRWE